MYTTEFKHKFKKGDYVAFKRINEYWEYGTVTIVHFNYNYYNEGVSYSISTNKSTFILNEKEHKIKLIK